VPEGQSKPAIITIPTSDHAFAKAARRVIAAEDPATPAALENRLRRTFPRAVVRDRAISGETPVWYVYRDGGWRPEVATSWWEAPGLPRVVISTDGWLREANATALGLLELDNEDLSTHHFTDFVAPGTLDDSMELFRAVAEGNPLTAAVLVRPMSGHVLAVDIHAWMEADAIVGVLKLAEDVELPPQPVATPHRAVVCEPATDVAFRGYVDLALSRMPEFNPDVLALRLRRLYPHAEVVDGGDHWLVLREPAAQRRPGGGWWTDPGLASVRYDAQGLIVDANDAAVDFLGRPLVGHYWQEFVTPGSTEQVAAMLEILAEVGAAESRFRMPRADGSLVEFDSYTEVTGESYTTVMRAVQER
jgi:PAS domain-containing protein